MSGSITVKAHIYNLPKDIDYPFIIVRHIEDELWYYGMDDDFQRASDVALSLKNGFVFEVEKGAIE